MRIAIALTGVLAAGFAAAQPIALPIVARPLPMAARDARVRSEFRVFAGKPLSGPFRVGPGLAVPAQARSFEMDMVRTTLAAADGSGALFMVTTLKTPVDILRPMITIRLRPHAKPYLADCALSVGDPDQHVAYLDGAEPMYHSKIMAAKSVAAVQDGHALFAIAPATVDRYLYVAPIVLTPTKAWSLSFDYCEFSQVG